ncbi:hypothetical protein MSAN_02292600 [Mycena sanguinolenta]|uniref:Uncharacterized protein n=1 Tax=Mycena sanguinolenta TaxID=230812 RepID=A0A8H6X9V7_9AGAR|nr:hypothetical protein MSAN_02292600 [Mycena sanguinolenta]
MSVPQDVFLEVVDALAARHPRALRSMALASRKAHELIKERWFRVLCVQDAPRPSLHQVIAGARSGWRRTGFPLVTYSRFVELLRDRPEEVRAVRHLHIAAVSGDADAFGRVLESCPNLVTLWLDYSLPSTLAPGIARLEHLRELTIPMDCPVEVVLPSVTHVHFQRLAAGQTFDMRVLAAFPSLTHLGFESETLAACAQRVAESSESLRVLVRVGVSYEYEDPSGRLPAEACHPRVVYMVRFWAGHHWEWLKRASPSWNPWVTVEDDDDVIWDHWTVLDAVLEARKDGRLQDTVVSNHALRVGLAARGPGRDVTVAASLS